MFVGVSKENEERGKKFCEFGAESLSLSGIFLLLLNFQEKPRFVCIIILTNSYTRGQTIKLFYNMLLFCLFLKFSFYKENLIS